MKIAIIGMGNVGFTLGKKWVQAKHEVTFGSRPESIQKHRKKLSEKFQAKAESVRTAASDADVIVLAVPHTQSLNVADYLRDIKGKSIIDVSNWFNPDFSSLALGFSTSGAEEIQKRLPNSYVVKAFNHYGADVMENPQFGDRKAVLYFCGSNAEAFRIGTVKNSKNFFRVDGPGALDENWSWESLGGNNNGKFGVRHCRKSCHFANYLA